MNWKDVVTVRFLSKTTLSFVHEELVLFHRNARGDRLNPSCSVNRVLCPLFSYRISCHLVDCDSELRIQKREQRDIDLRNYTLGASQCYNKSSNQSGDGLLTHQDIGNRKDISIDRETCFPILLFLYFRHIVVGHQYFEEKSMCLLDKTGADIYTSIERDSRGI